MDVRLLIPRVRRAIDGPTADSESATSATLTDAQVKDVIADAAANVIFYSNGSWPFQLLVTEYESEIPTEYEITPDPDLPDQTLLVAQAALDYFFHEFRDKKIQETIVNEARTWEYQLSANLLLEQFRFLQRMRDQAIEQIGNDDAFTTYVSFIQVRDAATSMIIEPYVDPAVAIGGLEQDYRFPGLPAGL